MSLFDHTPSLFHLAATFAGAKMTAGRKTPPSAHVARGSEFAAWVRYGYFLRFSIMLWLFAPVLCLCNELDQTLTSGMLVPETLGQYLIVAFFLVSAGFAALISARVVVIHGPERWDTGFNPGNDGRPRALARLFDNRNGRLELRAVLISQIPTVLVFFYFAVHGAHEQVSEWRIVPGRGAVVG